MKSAWEKLNTSESLQVILSNQGGGRDKILGDGDSSDEFSVVFQEVPDVKTVSSKISWWVKMKQHSTFKNL